MSESVEWRLMQQVLEEVRAIREELRARQSVAPAMLTMAQAAESLATSQKTVRRMVREGELVAVRVRKTPKIPASEVKRMATRFPSMNAPGSGRPVAKRKLPNAGYSAAVERARLAELRKKKKR